MHVHNVYTCREIIMMSTENRFVKNVTHDVTIYEVIKMTRHDTTENYRGIINFCDWKKKPKKKMKNLMSNILGYLFPGVRLIILLAEFACLKRTFTG